MCFIVNQHKCIMGTQTSWDGTFLSNDFYMGAKALCERWKEMDSTLPQWTWIPSKGEDGYLSLENVYYHSSNEGPVHEVGVSEEEQTIDRATLAQYPSQKVHIYDFQIVYSFSYRVPVLYFRGYRCGGQPLNLQEIKKDLPTYSLSLLKESKWTFITHEEHPYLHCPWYMLHPCGTNDWMRLLLCDHRRKDLVVPQYLPAWLSVVSQAVGLRIPLNLYSESFRSSGASIGDENEAEWNSLATRVSFLTNPKTQTTSLPLSLDRKKMEGLIPLVYRTIRKKKTRSYYKCLSTGTAQRLGSDFEAWKLLPSPPTPQKLGEGVFVHEEKYKTHRRHCSFEDSSMKRFEQEKPYQYSQSARSIKGGNSRIFSCIGC